MHHTPSVKKVNKKNLGANIPGHTVKKVNKKSGCKYPKPYSKEN